eukprot:Nk52_evm38s1810 gene=Nk52_evmTU38s1810
MAMRFLGQKIAQQIDVELMSTYSFTLNQLMELAGLSVACSVMDAFPSPQKIAALVGPGNNGGDLLVAARHLKHFGFDIDVFYPKQPERLSFLVNQCADMKIPVFEELPKNTENPLDSYGLVMDGVFGFSFSGSVRPPFDDMLGLMYDTKSPVCSIDIPSGWDVEKGDVNGTGFVPNMLVSLTAPKLCAEKFANVHYVGGRFVPPELITRFNLDIPPYEGANQFVKISSP